MFTATLFTIAKILKQPKYPLIDEWIKKINRKEYYSVIKKKRDILPFMTIQMDFEGIMVSEISQTGKGKYCMNSLIWEFKKIK